MKKLAKILLLLLVVGALAGVFAFAAMANTEAEPELPVGSYVTPEGAWVPSGDYANISYGAWAKEQDYLDGKAPAVWFSTDAEAANYGINLTPPAKEYTYVHVFSDSLTMTDMYTPLSAHTINLGGHTLGDAVKRTGGSFSSRETTVTVKNGTVYNNAHTQGYKLMVFDNVYFNTAYGAPFYGFTGDITLKNSVMEYVTDSGANGVFFIDNHGKNVVRNLIVENTDIIIKGNANNDAGVFSCYTRSGNNGGWNIFIDKNSSITGNFTTLVSIRNINEGYVAAGSHNLYIEDGCEIASTAIDSVVAYKYFYADGSYQTGDATDPASFLNVHFVKNTTSETDFTKYEEIELGKDPVYLTAKGDNYVVSVAPLNIASWYVFEEGATFTYGAAPVLNDQGVATITKEDIMSFPKGATILFAQDIATNFADSAQFFYANNLTIDLSGNTLYASHKWNIDQAEDGPALVFTVKNGNVVSSATQIFMGHPGDDAVITFEDVNFTNNYAREVIHIYSGTLNVTRCNFTGTDYSRPGDSTAIRLSTTGVKVLNLTDSKIVGYNGIRMDANSGGAKITVNVNNSTIEAENAAFIVRDGETEAAPSAGIEINVANSKVKAPTLFAETPDGDAYPAIDAPVSITVSKTYLSATPVYKTANKVVTLAYGENEVIYFDTSVPGYMYLVCPKRIWAPDPVTQADVTYAVWENEESYLKGDGPITSSTSGTINSDETKAFGSYFMVLYKNMVYNAGADQYTVKANAVVVIELNGFTWETTTKIRLNSNSKLTLRNGTYLCGGQNQFNVGSVFTLDRITLTPRAGYGTQLGYNAAGSLVIKDSDITLTHLSPFTFGVVPASYATPYVDIINSKITLTGDIKSNAADITSWEKGSAIFTILHNETGKSTRTITIDGNSTIISSNATDPIWFTIHNSAGDVQNTVAPSIAIEEGFTFNNKVMPNFRYAYKNSTTSVFLDSSLPTPEGVTKLDLVIKVVDANGREITEQLYGNVTATANFYKLSTKTNVTGLTGYYVYPNENRDRIILGQAASLASDGVTALFTQAHVTSLPEYYTMLFAQDMILETRVESYGVKRNDKITFDLGGNTFYLKAKFDLEYYDTKLGGRRPTNTIFKNGIIESLSADGKFGGFGEPNSVYEFNAIEFRTVVASSLIGIYTGTVRLVNCTSDVSQYLVAFDSYNGYHCIQIDGGYYKAHCAVSLPYSSGNTMNLGFEDCYIKNAEFLTSSYAVSISNVGTAGTAVNLDFSGNKIYGDYAISVNNSTVGNVNIRISNCYFKGSALTNNFTTNLITVTFGEGEIKMGIAGVRGLNYYIGKKPTVEAGKLQSNLTLYTDFTLNFFADKSVISAIYMNGAALTAEDFEGMNKYQIKGISAANAADAIELVLYVKSGEVTYKIPTTYSVLNYANGLIAKNDASALSKQLVTAAMEYVKAAYTYSGKTAPAFAGVAVTAATAPTTTTANLPELIAGAQLSLGENLKLRFTLAEGKSGTLKVGDATYIVENGKVGAVNYVEVDMRAYAFYNANIVVSDGTTTGTYTLAHYVNAVKGNSNAELAKLVNAFYTYTKYANEYKATGALN